MPTSEAVRVAEELSKSMHRRVTLDSVVDRPTAGDAAGSASKSPTHSAVGPGARLVGSDSEDSDTDAGSASAALAAGGSRAGAGAGADSGAGADGSGSGRLSPVVAASKLPITPTGATHRYPRVPISIINCGPDFCEPLPPSSSIRAQQLSVRDASILWSQRPKKVLVVKRWRSPDVAEAAADIASWLQTKMEVEVVTVAEPGEELPGVKNVTPAECSDVDLIVCLGGDGTVLHTSFLFPEAMPPMLPVAFGSLGFMTTVAASGARTQLRRVLMGHDEPINVSLRMRLDARLIRRGSTKAERIGVALNEILLDRGGSPIMATLEAFVDGCHLTTVQADGIIIATPTGSTAYSLSAGGSIALPTVPCILFTPICPHTLSFRPLLLPDSTNITIMVAEDSRASAFCSTDGKGQMEIKAGDRLVVRMSAHPVTLVSKATALEDWIRGVNTQLHWNMRGARQKAMPATLPHGGSTSTAHADADSVSPSAGKSNL